MKININHLLLMLIAFSFIYPVALFSNIYIFDILLVVFILKSTIEGTFKINKFSKDVILIGSTGIIISMFLLFFSTAYMESLLYLGQLLMVTTIIPLFLMILIQNNLFKYFLNKLFLSIILLLFLLGISFIYKIYFGINEFFYIHYGWGSLRLGIGSFLPADLNHYFVLSLFLGLVFIKSKYKNNVFTLLSFLLFILTQSKTIVVTMFIYLLKYNKKVLILSIFPIIYLAINFQNEISIIERVINIGTADYSEDGTDAHRIHMINDVINNLEQFVLYPIYGNMNNFYGTAKTNISSTHNIIFSIIANLGLISFMFYFILLSIIVVKIRKKFNWIISFIFLDILTLMINPIMTIRIAWLPLYIYIYYFRYYERLKD
jgi:hypothetical protein